MVHFRFDYSIFLSVYKSPVAICLADSWYRRFRSFFFELVIKYYKRIDKQMKMELHLTAFAVLLLLSVVQACNNTYIG